jgi:O-antigen/teichoic acid export membrane protein
MRGSSLRCPEGILDVAWTLSMVYVMLVLSSLNSYYLPVLSASRDAEEQRQHVAQVLRFSFMAMLPLVTFVIAFKPWIIRTLYSESFLPALLILRWMLIGDFLKVASWVLAIPMVAAARMRAFFWAELAANSLLLGLTWWAIVWRKDLESAGIAFVAVYVVYVLITAIYLRAGLKIRLHWSETAPWLAGLCLVGFISAYTWNDTVVRFSTGIAAVLGALVVVYLSLTKAERRSILIVARRQTGTAQ